jgi:hypothetical protein
MSQFTLFPGILVAFRCQVSGVRRETGRTCAVLKANAANLNTETRPSFRRKCKLLLLDFERCRKKEMKKHVSSQKVRVRASYNSVG